MIGSNRAARRSATKRRGKAAAVAGAAATAMTIGLAGAPAAEAAIAVDVNWNPTYTAGTLAGILDFVGNTFPGTSLSVYNSGPPQTVGFGLPLDYPFTVAGVTLVIRLDINAKLTLDHIRANDTQSIYNTLAGIPAPTCTGKNNYASNCRYALMLGTSEATLSLVNALRAEIASVEEGVTPQGYIPFQAAPGSTAQLPTWTNQALAFLQNPVRPNGGFLARFPDFAEFLGQDPSMPSAGYHKSPDGTIVLNNTTIDATWAYDPTGDFPAAFEFFSIVNSLMAGLPLNLVGGLNATNPFVIADSEGKTAGIDAIGTGLFSLFQVQIAPTPIGPYALAMEPGKAYYATIVPNQLPILAPMRLPSLLINGILGALGSTWKVGTPLADALEPAMKILVNIGYTDVVTPAMIAADPAKYAQYQPYDRTYLESATSVPFGSVATLNPTEESAVPGDVFQALLTGFRDQFAKPFFGILEDTSATAAAPTAAVAPATAARAAATQAAAVTPAPEATAVAETPARLAVTAKPTRAQPAHRAGSAATRSAVTPPASSGSNSSDDIKPAASVGGRHRAGTR